MKGGGFAGYIDIFAKFFAESPSNSAIAVKGLRVDINLPTGTAGIAAGIRFAKKRIIKIGFYKDHMFSHPSVTDRKKEPSFARQLLSVVGCLRVLVQIAFQLAEGLIQKAEFEQRNHDFNDSNKKFYKSYHWNLLLYFDYSSIIPIFATFVNVCLHIFSKNMKHIAIKFTHFFINN